MFRKLKFEEMGYFDLKQIPLSTQYKLDAVGVKIRPETWNSLSLEARQLFCHIPVKTDQDKDCYRNYLLYLLKRLRRQVQILEPGQVQQEKAQWENPGRIPDGVYRMVVEMDFTLSPQDWLAMNDFQRYALFQLSKGNHGLDDLNAALAELLPVRAKVSTWKKKAAAEPFAGERTPVVAGSDRPEPAWTSY